MDCNKKRVRGQKLLARFFCTAWNDRTVFLRFREILYYLRYFRTLQAAQIKAFACLNIHAGMVKCYAVDRHFWGWEYKRSTFYLLSLQSRIVQGLITCYRVTYHHGLRTQAVYPFALSWLPNSRKQEKPSRTRSAKFILDGFSCFCYSSCK